MVGEAQMANTSLLWVAMGSGHNAISLSGTAILGRLCCHLPSFACGGVDGAVLRLDVAYVTDS
jgi:hypothetical protein